MGAAVFFFFFFFFFSPPQKYFISRAFTTHVTFWTSVSEYATSQSFSKVF